MPEFNRKLAVLGLKKAEKDFERYLGNRVVAEKSTVQLEKELEQTGRELGRALKEMQRGR